MTKSLQNTFSLIGLLILTIIWSINSQDLSSISPQEFLDRVSVSAAVFRGKILTVIPHPIDTSTKIYRIKVTKFLKGCGDSNVNLYIKNNDIDISKFNRNRKNSSGFDEKIEIIVFACAQDENGISWDLNQGMKEEAVLKWNFTEHFSYEQELENYQGCLDCCSSGGQCTASVKEAEELNRKNKVIKERNLNKNDNESLGNLLKDFSLKKNRLGANFFF